MTDVEKYGLFALVFVGAILGLIVLQGAWDDEAALAAGAVTGKPVVMRAPASMSSATPARESSPHRVELPRPSSREASAPQARFTVSPLARDRGSFEWDEDPVIYPGPRSVSPSQLAAQDDAAGAVHRVRKGETLSDISMTYFGTSTRWRDLLALNPDLDPLKLQVGDVIRVSGPRPAASGTVAAAPALSASQPARSTSTSTYTVRTGDTLGGISQKMLGTVTRASEIYQANRDKMKSPDQLKVGMVLRIPSP